jgi:hypothetical protein
MKRILIAAILGIAVTSPCLGEGKVQFENYTVNNYAGAPIFYTPGVLIPGSYGFNAELAYAFGTVSDPAGNGGLLPAFALQGTLVPIGGIYSFGPGYFCDIWDERIPDYVSGPITFEVLAFSGASYDTSIIRGHSAAFTLPYIATGIQLNGRQLNGMQSFTLIIPEPSGLALAGLGALMIYRRRKL